jgi:hypothetical protein
MYFNPSSLYYVKLMYVNPLHDKLTLDAVLTHHINPITLVLTLFSMLYIHIYPLLQYLRTTLTTL